MSKRVVILGAGESGAGAALLAQKQGYDVFVSDIGAIDPIYKDQLSTHNISFEEKNHSEEQILNADEIIKSPGIPDNAPLVVKAFEKNIPVISEIEFAARFTDAKLLAITGTNGKTTTTLLTYHILKECGLNVGLAGNVGFSFAKQVYENSFEFYVLEISSFQLDGMFNTHLEAGVLLNITIDHLNRYGYSFEKYAASKMGIGRLLDKNSRFIFNRDDLNVVNNLQLIQTDTSMCAVSLENKEASAFLSGNELVFDQAKIHVENLPLKGPHNYLNIMCAVEAARSVGLSYEHIFEALKTFKNAPHRLEFVAEVNGVKYFNDSKATNVDAVKYALQSFGEPIVLILGGVDKGNKYEDIETLVTKGVKAIVAMGTDNKKIMDFFKTKVSKIVDTHSLDAAIAASKKLAGPGDVVLLSPACASFDLFNNYEDRGDQFKAAVKRLSGEKDKNKMLVL